MDGCTPREQEYARRRQVQWDSRFLPSSSAHPRVSGLNLIVRFKGRQLHYLVGNASKDYEDESNV
jgi:hypothetical protein